MVQSPSYMLPGPAEIGGVQDILCVLPYRVIQSVFSLISPPKLLGLFFAATPDPALPASLIYPYFHLFTPYSYRLSALSYTAIARSAAIDCQSAPAVPPA